MVNWNNLDKLRPDATPSQERAWVGWRARSVFFRIGRTRQLPTEPLTDEIANSVVADESHRLAEILEGCMSSLSDGERQMMQLYLDGYNAEEIGQQIGVSRDAVYQRMHRAINRCAIRSWCCCCCWPPVLRPLPLCRRGTDSSAPSGAGSLAATMMTTTPCAILLKLKHLANIRLRFLRPTPPLPPQQQCRRKGPKESVSKAFL